MSPDDRSVGTVASVQPNRIDIVLEFDAPQGSAIVHGEPTAFPRVNGYVLIPSNVGSIVGQIEWIRVRDSSFPRRPGFRDFGLVDVPFPLREISAVPVGMLVRSADGTRLALRRGADSLPSVGDAVLIPTADELSVILSPASGKGRVTVGTAALGGDIPILVDPDLLFGLHLAVLGNTGAGKSSSIAGLIRWSVEAASAETQGDPPVRFIVLDPNGEYHRALGDLNDSVIVLRPDVSDGDGSEVLEVPAWMWDSREWAAFGRAAPQTQRPALNHALTELRSGGEFAGDTTLALARLLRPILRSACEQAGDGATYTEWPKQQDFGRTLSSISSACGDWLDTMSGPLQVALQAMFDWASSLEAKRGSDHPQSGQRQYRGFIPGDAHAIYDLAGAIVQCLPNFAPPTSASPDRPVTFRPDALGPQIESLPDRVPSMSGQRQNLAGLVMRIEGMLRDKRFRNVMGADSDTTLAGWLDRFMGGAKGRVAIVDLSLVPSDVLELVAGVVTRIVFEASQRHIRISLERLHTVLVVEEAHRFIPRTAVEGDDELIAAVTRQTFERVAREGRKFGIGLVISSQRPAELSPTVLSQCNSYLLHRIVNDRDQDIVRRLVPDNSGALLGELPSLPQRYAILLGAATALPIKILVRELPDAHRPRSDDPAFWDAWTTAASAPKWDAVIRDWVGEPPLIEPT